MIEATIYEARTGKVLRAITVLDEKELELNLGPDESWVEGRYRTQDAYYLDGEVRQAPPKPDQRVTTVFDPASWTWVDQRTPEQIAEDFKSRRNAAIVSINAAAGAARQRFITDIPGQEMIYKAKLDEARAFLSGPEPDTLTAFPLIASEVGITAETPYQIAVIWLWMAEVWIQAAARIESTRLSGIAAAVFAQDIDAVRAAEETAISALGAIQP